MNIVELYSTPECGLCRDAKQLLLKLQKEFPFRIEEKNLTEDHPKYREYLVSIPVVIVNQGRTLSGNIDETSMREALKRDLKPPRLLSLYKFLEALGFVTVGTGLFYGVTRNDEWQELYFFLAGIALFAVGRILEKRELKKSKA